MVVGSAAKTRQRVRRFERLSRDDVRQSGDCGEEPFDVGGASVGNLRERYVPDVE
jgi:hypothetical protein